MVRAARVHDLRIAVIGQSAFGGSVFKALREAGFTIVGAFVPPVAPGTKEDDLAANAAAAGVPLFRFKTWRKKPDLVADPEVLEAYRSVGANLNVMAFVTAIIPDEVLFAPEFGTIEYHPSLLPRHRGRSAINHALLDGDRETGLTVFYVDQGIDTGDILLQRTVAVEDNDTVNSLYRRFLFPEGTKALVDATALIAEGKATRTRQNEALATYEGPWEGDVAHIDWTRSANDVHNFIRGSDRSPGAWTEVCPLRGCGRVWERARGSFGVAIRGPIVPLPVSARR